MGARAPSAGDDWWDPPKVGARGGTFERFEWIRIPCNMNAGLCATAFFLICQRLAGRRVVGPAASGRCWPPLSRGRMPGQDSRLPICGTARYRGGGRYPTGCRFVDATGGDIGRVRRDVDRRFCIGQCVRAGCVGNPCPNFGDDRAWRLVGGCQALWQETHRYAVMVRSITFA
jgi:hypothetical protein